MDEKDILVKIVNESNSLSDVLRKLGKSVSGTSLKILKNKLSEYGINFSFLKEKEVCKRSLDEILVENSTYCNSFHLLERLIKEGVKEYKCECCGINEWNGKQIKLQLHHKNGKHSDNRKENLQILCPNCHTQTENWGNKRNVIIKRCPDCGCEIGKRSHYCRRCVLSHNKVRNIQRPSFDELRSLICEFSFKEIAEKYGVSDSSVRKWCKKYGLPYNKVTLKNAILKSTI